MASLRKKYSTHIESPRDADAPVMSPPAADPPPAVETKPVEPMVESSPAEEAAQNALRQRLKEMENAEALQRQQQQPQHAEEPQQQEPVDPVEFVLVNSGLPERAKVWLRKHPEFVLDQEKNAELQHFHFKARREAGSEFDDGYYGALERYLGLQHTQPNGNGRTESAPAPAPTRPMQKQQPAPAVRPSAAPVSAPPSREAVSMRTGRPVSYRAPLSRDELEVAAASGMTAEQYQQQKERMLKMKAAGEIQG